MKKAERIAVSVGVAIIAGLGASGANAGPFSGCARCISDGNGPYYLAPSSSSPDVVAPLSGVGLAPAVPEPSSLALFGSGLLGLYWYRRRRARRG